jgi:CheY-like chemotaxis protein
LLDIEMPEMDGYQVAQAIRDTALVNASTPIVALTAYSGEHFRALSRGAGMQGFITKPLRLASLADEISSAIGL